MLEPFLIVVDISVVGISVASIKVVSMFVFNPTSPQHCELVILVITPNSFDLFVEV